MSSSLTRASLLATITLISLNTAWANPEILAPNGDLEQWVEAPENRPPQHIATADRLVPANHNIIIETTPEGQAALPAASQDSLIKHSGNYAIKLTNSTGENSVALSSKEIPVEPGQRYRVKVWLRGENIEAVSKESAVFVWVHQGPKEQFWAEETSIRKPHRVPDALGSFEWMPFEVEAETRPEDNLIRIAVQLRKSTGDLWVDDVELIPVATP
jgi:hypothetical protein